MNAHDIEKRITQLLQPHHNPKRAKHSVGYMNTRLRLWGCDMSSIRHAESVMKVELLKQHTHTTIRQLLNEVIRSTKQFEVIMVCLVYYCSVNLTIADWRILKTWHAYIDNWAHSDLLSSIYANLLEQHPEIYAEFVTWNSASSPWKRRLSLTSLLYYSSARKHPLTAESILPLIEARLKDEDIYVQKAVGWTLRECGNLYPKITNEFIQKHINSLSAIAFSSATEKWSASEKAPLKQQRKEYRKQQRA